MMKNFISIFLLMFFHFMGFSQSTNENLSKITPLTPNSAAFEKYGIVPVNLSSGVITPSIPLFSIPVGKNTFNLNINYSSQGLRVDENPTNFGMGWSLNLGSITRTVKDKPDELKQKVPPISQIVGDDLFFVGNNINSGEFDSQKDIFTVNVDGFNTKFILDDDEYGSIKVKKLTIDNIKVEILVTPFSNLTKDHTINDKIRIIAPNGNKYYFGGNEGFESCYSRINEIGGHETSRYVVSWLLSHVEYTDGNSLVITYGKNDQVNYQDGFTQTATVDYLMETNTQTRFPRLSPATSYISNITGSIAYPLTIKSGNTTVSFNVDHFSNYLDNNFPKINSMTISSSSKIIKEVSFLYNPYLSLEVGNNIYSKSVERPFLESIIFKDTQISKIYDYKLEYYNPTSIPNRLSFSQDILGYYNGASNGNFIFNSLADYNNFPDYEQIIPGDQDFTSFIYNVTGDRKPNHNFSQNGSLKKITYPTKGYSIFNYEGNKTSMREMVYPPFNETFMLANIPTSPGNGAVIKDAIVTVPFDQKFYITRTNHAFVDWPGSNCQFYENLNSNISITEMQNNVAIAQVPFYEISDKGLKVKHLTWDTEIGNKYFFELNSPARLYAEFEKDKTYKISIMVKKCYSNVVNFAYRDAFPHLGDFVEAGGLRIASIQNYDKNDDLLSTKIYEYEGGNYTISAPVSTMDSKIITVGILSYENTLMGYGQTGNVMLSSNPRWGLRNISGEFYTYSKVIEKDLDSLNNNKGSIAHIFSPNKGLLPSLLQGAETSTSNFTTTNYQSNELFTVIYDSNNQKLNEREYHYYTHPSYNNAFPDYTAKRALELKCANFDNINDLFTCPMTSIIGIPSNEPRWWSIWKSYTAQTWEYLQSQKTTDYLNGKPVVTKTDYFYNNPLHYQLTSQSTTFPDNSVQVSNYQYAHEKGNQYLIDKNIVSIPLQTTVTKNNIGISSAETKYPTSQTDANTQTSGLPLPTSVISYGVQIPGTNSSPTTEVTFDFYDTKGNLLQYTTKSGVPTAIIWGYNQTQPIAKIEGATYAQVSSLATALVTSSNADIDATTEQNFIAALDTFRKDSTMSGYQITTYTYDPLIGVTTITPPSGIREYYIYDTANRLQSAKDINGKILKEYQYNYKP